MKLQTARKRQPNTLQPSTKVEDYRGWLITVGHSLMDQPFFLHLNLLCVIIKLVPHDVSDIECEFFLSCGLWWLWDLQFCPPPLRIMCVVRFFLPCLDPKRVFPIIRHIEVQDLSANLMTEACHDVLTRMPSLVRLCIIARLHLRVNMRKSGFWHKQCT